MSCFSEPVSFDSDEDEDALPEILSYHHPTVELHPDLIESPPYPTESPVTFYDKHLDEYRALRHVKRLSSLTTSLTSALDRSLASFEVSHGGQPLTMRELHVSPQSDAIITDATSVAEFYREGIAEQASIIASMLAIHPNLRQSDTILSWSRGGALMPRDSFAVDVYRLAMANRRYPTFDEVLEVVDEEMGGLLLELIERLPVLGIWDVYIPQGEKLLQSMEDLTSLDTFPWQTCNTTGCQRSPPLSPVLDADPSATHWRLPPIEREAVAPHHLGWNTATMNLRRSTRLEELHFNANVPSKSVSRIAHKSVICDDGTAIRLPNVSRSRRHSTYHTDPAHYVQHAWCRAVASDSTVIVFDCGHFQRIGIRHRESQTLYLSDLIDTRSCEGPAYGKLQAGIHLAIIQDAMNRVQRLKGTGVSSATAKPHKRDREDDANASERKRRKVTTGNTDGVLRHNESQLATEETMRQFAIPNLLLVRFRYDSYNSPSPAPFIRSGPMLFPREKHLIPLAKPRRKLTYAAHQYLTLTLGPQIGHGAVGNVHRGTLHFCGSDGTSLSCSAVAKLAFSSTQQEQLRHEYSVYLHLVSSEVELLGIVRIFGLFGDTEGGPVALVMGDGGSPLGYRHDANGQVKVPPDESIAFLHALDSIHNAGVRHCDIRSWNLLAANDGKVSIIDFDRAKLNPTESERRREREDLVSLLDGRYVSY